jgi:ABC-type branched-subunit amino acid transport system substrate-binding protein
MIVWPVGFRCLKVVSWMLVAMLPLTACSLFKSEKQAQPPPPETTPMPEGTAGTGGELQIPDDPSVADADLAQAQALGFSLLPYLRGRTEGYAGAGASPPPPLAKGHVRVAILLPLSGPHSALGQSMLNAAQLAVFDLADDRFELLPYDTAGSANGAAQAARNAIADGCSMILGPLLANSVRAVTPVAWATGVPVVAFSSDRTVAISDVYIIGFTPAAQVERVVSYAQSQGLKRFAAIAPNNAYGKRVVESLGKAVAADGQVVSDIAYFDPGTSDFNQVVGQVAGPVSSAAGRDEQGRLISQSTEPANAPGVPGASVATPSPSFSFDALLLADGGERLRAIAAHLPFYGIDASNVRLLGTGAWDEPGLGAEPSLVGGWFAAPVPGLRTSFEHTYQQLYAAKPPRLATLAYDGAALAVVLAERRANGMTAFSRKVLLDPRGFKGRDGLFRFGPDGVAERALAVLEVTREGNVVVSEPPASFPPASSEYGY